MAINGVWLCLSELLKLSSTKAVSVSPNWGASEVSWQRSTTLWGCQNSPWCAFHQEQLADLQADLHCHLGDSTGQVILWDILDSTILFWRRREVVWYSGLGNSKAVGFGSGELSRHVNALVSTKESQEYCPMRVATSLSLGPCSDCPANCDKRTRSPVSQEEKSWSFSGLSRYLCVY